MPKQTVEMRELVGMSPASGGGTTPILSKNIYNGPAASGAIPEKYANPVTDDTIAYSEMSVDGTTYPIRVHDDGEISINRVHGYGSIQPEDSPVEIHQIGGLATVGRSSDVANVNKIVSVRNRSRVNYIVGAGDITVEDNIIKKQNANSYVTNIIPMSPTLYILSQFGDNNLYAYDNSGESGVMYETVDPFCYGPIIAMAADMSVAETSPHASSVDEIYVASKELDGRYRITRLPVAEFMTTGAFDDAKFVALAKSNTGAILDTSSLPQNAYLASIAITNTKVFIGFALAGGDGKPMPITNDDEVVADNQDLLFSINKVDIPAYGDTNADGLEMIACTTYVDDDDEPTYAMYKSKLPWQPYHAELIDTSHGGADYSGDDFFGESQVGGGTQTDATHVLIPHKFVNDNDEDIISKHSDNMEEFIGSVGDDQAGPYPIIANGSDQSNQNFLETIQYWGGFFGFPIPGGMGLAPAAAEISLAQYITGQLAVVDYSKDVVGMLVTTNELSFAPVNGLDDSDMLRHKWGVLMRYEFPSYDYSSYAYYALLSGMFGYGPVTGSPGSILTYAFYSKPFARQTVHCKKMKVYGRNNRFSDDRVPHTEVAPYCGTAFLFTWNGEQASVDDDIEYALSLGSSDKSPYDAQPSFMPDFLEDVENINRDDVIFNNEINVADLGTFTIKKYFDAAFNTGTNRGIIRLTIDGDEDYAPRNPKINNVMVRDGAAVTMLNTISDTEEDIAMALEMPAQPAAPGTTPPTWSEEQKLETSKFDAVASNVLCSGVSPEAGIEDSTIIVCNDSPALSYTTITDLEPFTFDELTEIEVLTSVLTAAPVQSPVEDSALVGVSQIYKYSFTYDGIQEGPLSEESIVAIAPNDVGEPPEAVPYSVAITISLPERFYLEETLSRRITHINIFAAELVGGEEATLYRLFKKVPLSTDYFTLTNRRWVYPSIVDVGMREETFEVLAGYPEDIKSPSIKCGCSCMYNGHIFAGNVFTYDEDQVEYSGNILVKSQPYQPSVYDYTREFAVLSFSPNTLVARDGKIYAFGNDEYSVVDADTLAVEGTNKILGCASANHVVANDYGVFVFYKDNVYALNGLTIEPMASHISRSEFTDIPTLSDPQVKESTTGNLLMGFSNSRQSLILIIEQDIGYIMYTYSFTNKTWVLYEMYGTMPGYLYHKDGEPYLADGTNVTGVFGDQPYPVIYLRWIMDLGDQADDVYIYSIKGKYKHNEVVIDSITINGNSFPVTINASDPNVYPGISDVNMAITSPVDCIDIVVRRKIVR